MESGAERYAALSLRLKELESEVEAVKGELRRLEPGLQEWLCRTGEPQLRTPELTLYLTRQVFLQTPRGPGVACHALKSAGLGRYVAERIVDERQLAHLLDTRWNPHLDGALTLAETFRLQTRKRNG